MSLKLAALGDLVSIRPLDAAMRTDDRTQNSGSSQHEPIVISLGWWSGVTPRGKPATGALRLFLHKAARVFATR